jgi:hypothetical protein
MKIKKHIIEVFENTKCIATLDHLDKWEDFLYDYIDKYNYKNVYESGGGDSGIYLLVNWVERKSVILSYKSYIGYKDKNGKKLYYNDIIADEFGNTSEIWQHYDNDHYYFRITKGWLSWNDYDIEDFKKYTKVSDVLDNSLKQIR